MRVIGFAALALVACGTPDPVAPSAPPPVASYDPTCGDAADGLERGTRDLRDPGTHVAVGARKQCVEAPWPMAAIRCFAKLTDLGACATKLPTKQRDALLALLGGTDRASIVVGRVRLSNLKLGIAACDAFVATVVLVLGCDALSIEQRAGLANETVDMWALPDRLDARMQDRMAAACMRSNDQLVAIAKSSGCL